MQMLLITGPTAEIVAPHCGVRCTVQASALLSGSSEHAPQNGNFLCEIVRVVADEKTAIVCDVGVLDFSSDLIVEVPDGVVAQEAAARNHAKSNAGAAQRIHHGIPVDPHRWIQDERETEPGTSAILPLEDEAVVILEQLDEQCRVAATDLDHDLELLQLFESNRAANLEGSDVIAGEQESIGLEKRVGGASVVQRRVVRHVARPPVVPNGA